MSKEGKNISLFDLFRLKEGGELVDPDETPEFERKFIHPLSIIGIVFSLLSILLHSFWNFDEHLTVVACLALVFYTVIYFMARKKKYISTVKWVFILVTVTIISYAWYFDYRSHGPTIYLLVLLYGYLTFMLGRKDLILVSILLLTDFLILFFLDYGGYLPPARFPNNFMLMVDVYFSVVLYTLIAFILISTIKRIYFAEYNKALESDRLKTAFLSNISHEIRTPLNAVIGFSNLMLTENIPPEEREQYKFYINENNKFLLVLVNDILDISLIESHNVQLDIEPCELNYLLSELEDVYSAMLVKEGKSGVELIKNIPQKGVVMDIDKDHLEHALSQLLDNAVKFTDKGRITIGYSEEGKMIRFFVKDTGTGIKEEDLPHIFERFNKLEYSNEKIYPGTGIGLYLVKLIVGMFGGEVFVKSTYGLGSDFSFILPVKKFKADIEEDQKAED